MANASVMAFTIAFLIPLISSTLSAGTSPVGINTGGEGTTDLDLGIEEDSAATNKIN